MNFSRTFPKALLVFAMVLAVFVISAPPAHAKLFCWPPFSSSCGVLETLGEVAVDIIKGLTGLINSVILFIAGLFFWLANQLIGTALDLNNDLASGKESIVNAGHKIVLGVANMGFIVALAVIAFATMLRWEGFSYKKALPRVIIAALLINFGFFIVTNWLISPVNQITEAFRASSNFDLENSFAVFKDTEGVGKVASENIVELSDDDIIGALAKGLASVLFTALFSFLGFLTLMAFAAMLFVRYIALSILVILLPIAWITWIFPNLKIPGGHPWTVWWENFTRWLLFAPFAMFFFYLATGLANKGIPPANTESFTSYLGGLILIIGLLLGGLVVSNKMGVSGGAMALGAVATMKGWAKLKTKQYGDRTKEIALRNKYADKGITRMQDLGSKWRFGGRQLSAPVRKLGRSTAGAAFRAERAVDEAAMKEFEGMPPYAIRRMRDGLSERKRYAADLAMANKGYEWEDTEQARNDWAKWEKEGRFDPRKGGNPLLSLQLLDRGVSTEVLAARADLDESINGVIAKIEPGSVKDLKDASVQDRDDWVKYNKSRISSEDNAELERLEGVLEDSWVKAINIIGYKGLGKINHRLNSAPGSFQPWGDRDHPEFHDWYRENLTDHALNQIPGATNMLLAGSRGDAADFINARVALAIDRNDNNFIKPVQDEIKAGIQADIAALRADTSISDEARERRISVKQEEFSRITDLSRATPQDRDQWLQRHWDDLTRKAPKETARQTANQIAGRFNQLFAAGKRAYFVPYAPAEGAPPPPPPAA